MHLPFVPRSFNWRHVQWLGAALCSAGSLGVGAQTPSAQAPAPKVWVNPLDVAPSERVKRDAEKVFYWIKLHGEKGSKPAAVAGKDDRREEKSSPKASAAAAVAASPSPSPTTVAAKPAPAPTKLAAASPAPSSGDTLVAEAPRSAVAELPQAASAMASLTGSAAPSGSDGLSLPSAPQASPGLALPPQEPVMEDSADEGLKLISQVEPEFPRNLMRTLRKGQVRVQFDVMPDGSVDATEVILSSNPRLNKAALDAVKQWRFEPIRRAQQVAVELAFNLEAE